MIIILQIIINPGFDINMEPLIKIVGNCFHFLFFLFDFKHETTR